MAADLSRGCYSVLENYTPTVGCYIILPSDDIGTATATSTVNGSTIYQLVETLTATTPFSGPITTTFDSADFNSLVGVTVAPMLTLIHHQTDIKAATALTATTAFTSNAAVRVARGSTSWHGFGAVLGVSVAAMALGAAIILPF